MLVKLWLIHDEQIVGSATQYDALWYVRSASHYYWGTPYDWVAFIRPCAYPLWIALMHSVHLPLRLAIELLQMGGVLTLILAFRVLGVTRWISLLGLAAMIFHPIAFQQNDYTMSDTFYAGMLWLVLGGLLLTLASSHRVTALLTGIAIAILWNTREEGLLLSAIVALATILLVKRPTRISDRLQSKTHHLQPVAIVWFTAALLILATYSINHSVFRSFARSEMTAPVFQRLYHSLLRIRPNEPKSYASITTASLQRAFAVSPTFAHLRKPLEGPLGEAWRVETFRRTGLPNEIGVGWIVWATRQAAASEGYFASPKSARRFFTKSSQEISRACDDGRLPTRFVLGGFLDPFTQSGAGKHLPGSSFRMLKRVFARWSIKALPDDSELTKQEALLYDRMTLRPIRGAVLQETPAKSAEELIGRWHFVAMFLLHAGAVIALVYLLLKRQYPNWKFVGAIGLALCAIFLRSALLIWLDATAFDATQDRFLLPILPLWSLVLVLVMGLGIETAAGRLSTRSVR